MTLNTMVVKSPEAELKELRKQLANLEWAHNFVQRDQSGCAVAMRYYYPTNPSLVDDNSQLTAYQKEVYAMVRGQDGQVTCQVIHDHVRASSKAEMTELLKTGYMPVGIIENVYNDILGFTKSEDHLDEYGIEELLPERQYSPLEYLPEKYKDDVIAAWCAESPHVDLEDSKDAMKVFLENMQAGKRQEIYKTLEIMQENIQHAPDYMQQVNHADLLGRENKDKPPETIDADSVDQWCYAQRPLEHVNSSYSKLNILGMN